MSTFFSWRGSVAVLSSAALVTGLVAAGADTASAAPEGTPGITVTDLSAPPAPLSLSRLAVGTVTLDFQVQSSAGQYVRPVVVDSTAGSPFTNVRATLTSGDRLNGTWTATATLASFMDGTHVPRVRVCPAANACVTRTLTTTIVVNGSDWPEVGRVTQSPRRLSAGVVTGATAEGRVVFSDTGDPAKGVDVMLVRHRGESGQLADTTGSDGRFSAPWPWAKPGEDPALLSFVLPAAAGAVLDRVTLGNPDTAFDVQRPKAPGVGSTNKDYVVTGTVTPGYPAKNLGVVRLQVKTTNGWRTRDSADLRQVRTSAGTAINKASYRLSVTLTDVGKYTMRVLKPAAMCREGHCRVAAGHSKPFSTVVGNRTYWVERHLRSLGVPVGEVDGVVDARAQQAFCAWRDMTGVKPSREGLSPKLASSIMRHSSLPKPNRTNGIYVNKTCQVLFQVKSHKYHRVVWVSTGGPGHPTPNGTGHIFRKIEGWVESTLYPGAFMLDPMFFFPERPGIALHGSVSNDLVEPYPASHACVRVWRPQIRKIFAESPLGTKVKIYGHY